MTEELKEHIPLSTSPYKRWQRWWTCKEEDKSQRKHVQVKFPTEFGSTKLKNNFRLHLVTVLLKTVAEHCPEVTSHLTTGTLTHDLHEVKRFWDTGWLEPLRFLNLSSLETFVQKQSQAGLPALQLHPFSPGKPEDQTHNSTFLFCWIPSSCCILTYWNLLNLRCSDSLDRGRR